MPIRIELPKTMLDQALEQAVALRIRRIKAESNPIIKEALEKEIAAIEKAAATMTER